MISIKHIALFCFYSFLIFSTEAQNQESDTTNVDRIVETSLGSFNTSQLIRDQKTLSIINFDQAVFIYGEPKEKEFIRIQKDSLTNIREYFDFKSLAKKHYPNGAYVSKKKEFLEASWFMQNQSWIIILYKKEDKNWVVIDRFFII